MEEGEILLVKGGNMEQLSYSISDVLLLHNLITERISRINNDLEGPRGRKDKSILVAQLSNLQRLDNLILNCYEKTSQPYIISAI